MSFEEFRDQDEVTTIGVTRRQYGMQGPRGRRASGVLWARGTGHFGLFGTAHNVVNVPRFIFLSSLRD